MKKIELLSPSGDFEKLKTAIHFGCDAVYLSGKKFGLRAFCDNFSDEELIKAIEYAHYYNVKVYVTINILAHNKGRLESVLGMLSIIRILNGL